MAQPMTPAMKKHGKRRREQSRSQLNLTSMIDVVFLLLIFFVFTTMFVESEGTLEASFPGEYRDVPELNRTIRVTVTSHGTYGAGYQLGVDVSREAPADFDDLHRVLKGLKESYGPHNPVIIAPRTNVRWQHVVNAFNAAVAAEFDNIAFEQATGED